MKVDSLLVKTSILILRMIGVVFIASSILKLASLRTSTLIINEFCIFLGYDNLYGHGMLLSIAICLMEILLGCAAFFSCMRLYVAWALVIVMGYFTYITYLNYTSLYGQIESCGCFGEVVHFTPAESFLKNVILLGLSLVVLTISLLSRTLTTK